MGFFARVCSVTVTTTMFRVLDSTESARGLPAIDSRHAQNEYVRVVWRQERVRIVDCCVIVTVR